jgi:chromosome segregation ATPase
MRIVTLEAMISDMKRTIEDLDAELAKSHEALGLKEEEAKLSLARESELRRDIDDLNEQYEGSIQQLRLLHNQYEAAQTSLHSELLDREVRT